MCPLPPPPPPEAHAGERARQSEEGRQPDPAQLAEHGAQAPVAEEHAHADGRDLQRAPGEEVAGVVEGRQQGARVPDIGTFFVEANTGTCDMFLRYGDTIVMMDNARPSKMPPADTEK